MNTNRALKLIDDNRNNKLYNSYIESDRNTSNLFYLINNFNNKFIR